MSYQIIPSQAAASGLGQPPGAAPQAPYCGSIRALQQMLSDLGFYGGIVDGLYGQQTENAMAQFKKEEGLGSGFVTSSDCARLIDRWNRKMAGQTGPGPTAPPPEHPPAPTPGSTFASPRSVLHRRVASSAAPGGGAAAPSAASTGLTGWWSAQSTFMKVGVVAVGVGGVAALYYLAR